MAADLPIFIVSNPSSGGTKGAELLDLGVPEIRIVDEELKLNVLVHLGDIRTGSSGDKPIFKTIKKEVDSHSKEDGMIRVIVAGGDGTVMWALSELEAHGLGGDRVAVGVLPFGTGNDFSRSTGFGGYSPNVIIGRNMSGLKKILLRYIDAQVSSFDIWKVVVKVKEGGSIKKIKDGRKVPVTDSLEFSKLCCNYFSVGVDGRIGLGFDRNRTKSACCNKTVYACEGFKKSLWRTNTIAGMLESVTCAGVSLPVDNPTRRSRGVSLVFMNVPSIAGGTDLWKCTGSTDVQAFSDGKIEVMIVPSVPSFVMANMPFLKNGAVEPISSSAGPFDLKFKDMKKTRCYCQVDGEFFQLELPDQMTVEHYSSVQVMIGKS